MIGESFSTEPLQDSIPSYLYFQYSDDDDLQAMVAAYNMLAGQYVQWFNSSPLGVYVSPAISGMLLDWIATGVYGIPRPSIVTSPGSVTLDGDVYNEKAYDSAPYNGFASSTVTPTSQLANDDIYKRTLTWILYRGDGVQMTVQWMKRRVARFLFGANGTDISQEDVQRVSVNDVPGQRLTLVPTGGINGAPANRLAVNGNKAKQIAIPSPATLVPSGTNTTATDTTATNENNPKTISAGVVAIKHTLFITIKSSPMALTFQRLVQNGTLPMPFQINIQVILS